MFPTSPDLQVRIARESRIYREKTLVVSMGKYKLRQHLVQQGANIYLVNKYLHDGKLSDTIRMHRHAGHKPAKCCAEVLGTDRACAGGLCSRREVSVECMRCFHCEYASTASWCPLLADMLAVESVFFMTIVRGTLVLAALF
jgi:hypothetical protein